MAKRLTEEEFPTREFFNFCFSTLLSEKLPKRVDAKKEGKLQKDKKDKQDDKNDQSKWRTGQNGKETSRVGKSTPPAR